MRTFTDDCALGNTTRPLPQERGRPGPVAVIGTTVLKPRERFTRLVPSLVVVVGYGVAFYCLSGVLNVFSKSSAH